MLADGCVDIKEINAFLLHEAFGDKSCLVPLDVALVVSLDFVDPLGRDGLHARRYKFQGPRRFA